MLWPQLSQYSDLGFFLLRLSVALIFLYHAWPKMKNPKAFAGMMGGQNMVWFPFVLGLAELVGALGVLSGVWLQVSALILVFVMLGAMSMKIGKWKIPFSAMDKMGWEFDLILLAASLLLLFSGGGAMLILGV
ncbi:MAG: DoxX family protein [Candidatus Magasanikbacteria bacterium]|nr:DoxX family protein [Candidatus Magasanikbacteria bacterium]